MNVGKYNHKIKVIYDANKSLSNPPTDDNGTPLEDWKELNSKGLWSRKQGLNAKLFYAAAATHSEADIIFLVRYSKLTASIMPDMRVMDNEGTYRIKAKPIDKDGNRQELTILAEEMLSGGS